MAVAAFNTTGMSVKVGTSSTAGYKLSMSVANGGQLVSGTNSIPSLPENDDAENPYSCTVATGASCNFEVNSWGYRLGTDTANVYKPIPATETEILDYTAGATDENTTDFAFGVRANAKQPGGSYETTINFIATANPEGIFDIKNVQAMQDFAMLSQEEYTAVLASMETGTSYELADNRDDNTYNIAKLADGNVWLQDNLQLDIAASKDNITSATTNAEDDVLTCLKSGCSSSTIYSKAAAVNTSYSNWSGDKRFTQAMYNIDNADYDASYGNGTHKSGYYYNYCAASAGSYCYNSNSGTGNATQDVCPAGWRMPAGGRSDYSYRKLYEAYGSDAADFNNALHVGLSGYFNGGIYNQGYGGLFWSSTFSGTSGMYNLSVGESSVNLSGGTERGVGLPVRCVLRPYAYDMQNVSAEIMASILPTDGSTYVMKDNRDDTEYTIGKLADGKYWMLDNLRLDPATLKTTLTTSNTNMSSSVAFILPASSTADFTDDTTNYENPHINTESKNSTQSYGNGSNKIGVYYNYCAASAGTYCMSSGSGSGNASHDICPAGWRMPTGGSSGEYKSLYNQYNNYTNFKNAFHASLSGYFINGSAGGQGSRGLFWSSTYNSGYNMYFLFLNTSTVNPENNSSRYSGHSVRCVYGS